MVTTYSHHYYDIKKIMTKHWEVLKNDRVLGLALPDHPQVIFRGVPPLKLQVTSNILDAPSRVSFFQKSKGFFPCWKFAVCYSNKNKDWKMCQFKSNVTARVYDINTFITWTSQNVVYLLICPCGLQYVGHTIRAMNVRIKDHVDNIKKGLPKHVLYRHYFDCHNKNPAGTTFTAIDRFTPHWRGSIAKRDLTEWDPVDLWS